MRMDITQLPGSRILDIARIAFATPDVDFLCFGESDQPSPAGAHAAAIAALDAGATRYPDVRGMPELRFALANYLTALHAKPVAEERIQVTASGMAAVSTALAATVRAGWLAFSTASTFSISGTCSTASGSPPFAFFCAAGSRFYRLSRSARSSSVPTTT